MARAQAECRRRLGREQRHLCAGARRSRTFPKYPLPDGLGASGIARRRRGPIGRRAARHGVPDAHAEGGWAVERPELHGARLSARVLFEISRLFRVFPALGAGGVPHTDASRNRSLNGVGVVAALDAEARTLGPAVRRDDGLFFLSDGALLAVSGMGAALAAIAARNLIDAGAAALISFGLAGGLDPLLSAGTVGWAPALGSPAQRRSARWARGPRRFEKPARLPAIWRASTWQKCPPLTTCRSSPCV